ncbi:MAG: hypothetical protein ACKPH3_09710, partial [Dolichospermum sp.]
PPQSTENDALLEKRVALSELKQLKLTAMYQYNFDNMTAQEIWDIYSKDPETMETYDQMLEQQFGKA